MTFDDTPSRSLLTELCAGRLSLVWSMPDGSLQRHRPAEPQGILCGSFDPLHVGHRALRDAAEARLQGPLFYEMTVFNADNPPLDEPTVDDRRRQFREHPLALTVATTFGEKAVLFPGVVFVVGIDTLKRILQLRFYGGRKDRRQASLNQVRQAGCTFLVASRELRGRLLSLGDLPIPDGCDDLFCELPADEFRADICSTRLRQSRRDS